MSAYQGRLKVAATADVIEATFEVVDQSLHVTTGAELLGTWALPDLAIERRGDGVHMRLDGEDVLVEVPDVDGFVAAIAPARRRPKGRRDKKRGAHQLRRRPVQPRRPDPASRAATPLPVDEVSPTVDSPEPKHRIKSLLELVRRAPALIDADNWQRWLQDSIVRWSIASIGVILLALLTLFATNTLGMILVLLGMIALIIAALAVSDDLSAYRAIPSAVSETGLVIAGAVAMVLGALLIMVG